MLDRRFEELLEVRHAGVVDEHVDVPEARARELDHIPSRTFVRDVGRETLRLDAARPQALDGLLEIGFVDRCADDHEPRPLGAQALGHRQSDPAARAADDRDLALEPRHRTSFPRSSYTPASTIVPTSSN